MLEEILIFLSKPTVSNPIIPTYPQNRDRSPKHDHITSIPYPIHSQRRDDIVVNSVVRYEYSKGTNCFNFTRRSGRGFSQCWLAVDGYQVPSCEGSIGIYNVTRVSAVLERLSRLRCQIYIYIKMIIIKCRRLFLLLISSFSSRGYLPSLFYFFYFLLHCRQKNSRRFAPFELARLPRVTFKSPIHLRVHCSVGI